MARHSRTACRFSTPSLSFLLSTAALFSQFHFAAAQNSTCYYPDGTHAKGAVPCNSDPTAGYSACCPSGQLCLGSGLCLLESNLYVGRSGCTDPTFSDSACSPYCRGVYSNTECPLIQFSDDTGANYFCCSAIHNSEGGNGGASCHDGNNANSNGFIIEPISILGWANSSYSSLYPPTSNGSASSSQSSSNQTMTVTDNSKVVAVGAGVGASLGALLVAAVAFAIYQTLRLRKLQRRLDDEPIKMPLGDTSYPNNTYAYMASATPQPRPPAEVSGHAYAELDMADHNAELEGSPALASPQMRPQQYYK